jgi:hypothetical protein
MARSRRRNHRPKKLATDFCNKIGAKRTCSLHSVISAFGGPADIDFTANDVRAKGHDLYVQPFALFLSEPEKILKAATGAAEKRLHRSRRDSPLAPFSAAMIARTAGRLELASQLLSCARKLDHDRIFGNRIGYEENLLKRERAATGDSPALA